MDSVKNIIIVGIVVVFFINFIVNKKVRDTINSFLKIKIFKLNITIGDVILGIVFVLLILNIVSYVKIIAKNVKIHNISTEGLEETLENGYNNSDEERKKYEEIMKIETDINNCQNPYLPDGFKYVEGTWDTGYVIEDGNSNQFVWIPCTNIKNNRGISILKRSDFSSNAFIKSFLCYEDNESYKQFLESALRNGGFYISRFEIGKDENGNPVSKKGYEIWTNITKEEAKEKASLMENTVHCDLINGYAYDTAFNFIYDDIDKNIYYKTEGISGTNSLKNIYDMVDDMYELTSEMQFDGIIYRGIVPENEYIDTVSIDNRLTASDDYFSDNLGFRTIIYKEQ